MDISAIGPYVPPTQNSMQDSLLRKLERIDSASKTGVVTSADKLSADKDKELVGACQEYESFFIYMLMKEMRKTVPENTLLNGGRAEEIFRDMMDEEMGKKIAKTPGAGIGIADMMYRQLSRQEIAKQQAASESAAADLGTDSNT